MDFLPKNLNIDVKIGKKLGYELENIVKSHGFEVNKAILVSDDNIFNNCKEFLPPQLLTDLSQILILDDPRPELAIVCAFLAAGLTGCYPIYYWEPTMMRNVLKF